MSSAAEHTKPGAAGQPSTSVSLGSSAAGGPDLPHLAPLPTGRVRWWTAGATVALAGLLSLGAYAGAAVLMAAGLLAVAVLAWGWPALLALPSPRGTTAVVGAGGAMAVLAVGLSRTEPRLQWLALAVAGSVLAEFVHQLARRDGRPRVVESSTGTLAGVALLASMSAWMALPRTPSGAGALVVAAVPVAVGLALQLLPLPARVTAALGVVAGLLAGALLGGALLAAVRPGAANAPVVLGGAVAAGLGTVLALMLHRQLAVLPAAGWAPGWLALAVGPLAASGMVSYVVLRLSVG